MPAKRDTPTDEQMAVTLAQQEATDLRQQLANVQLKLDQALKARADFVERERARGELVNALSDLHERVGKLQRRAHRDPDWTPEHETQMAANHFSDGLLPVASAIEGAVRGYGEPFGESGMGDVADRFARLADSPEPQSLVELHALIAELDRCSQEALHTALHVPPAWAATQD